jgi:hypothetical protein
MPFDFLPTTVASTYRRRRPQTPIEAEELPPVPQMIPPQMAVAPPQQPAPSMDSMTDAQAQRFPFPNQGFQAAPEQLAMPQADAAHTMRVVNGDEVSTATFPGGGGPATMSPPQGQSNPMEQMIRALGGYNEYGSSGGYGTLPTLNDFLMRNLSRDASPQERAALVQAYSGILGGGQTESRLSAAMPAQQAAQLMGAQAQMLSAQNQGRSADLTHGPDAQNAAAFNSFVQSRVMQGGNINDARREWQESGMRPPIFAGGSPLSGSAFPAQGGISSPIAGAAVPTVAGGPGAAQTMPGAPSPRTRLSQAWQAILNRHSQPPVPGQPRRLDPARNNQAITDFILSNQDLVNSNVRQIMPFLMEQMGGPAADAWAGQRFARGSNDPQARALHLLQQAVERVAPGTWGNSAINPQSSGPMGVAGLLGRMFQ